MGSETGNGVSIPFPVVPRGACCAPELELTADLRSLGVPAKHLADAALNLPVAGLLLSIDRPKAIGKDDRRAFRLGKIAYKRHPLRHLHVKAPVMRWRCRKRTPELGELRRSEQVDPGILFLIEFGARRGGWTRRWRHHLRWLGSWRH